MTDYDEKLWVQQFKREMDRGKRREILEKAIASEGMSPENELRKKLLDARYTSQNDAPVDFFIRGWMTMSFLNNSGHALFGKRKAQKELDSIRKDWKFSLAEEYGETGRQVLQDELYNMCRLYISLCQSDKQYGSFILGLGRVSNESLMNKISRDLFQVAYAIPEDLGVAEEFSIFTHAATDAFRDYFPESENLLMDRVNNRKK